MYINGKILTQDDVMDDDDEEDELNEPGDDYGNQTDLENDEDEEENKDEVKIYHLVLKT